MEMCLNFPDSSTKRSSKSSNVQNSRRDDDSSTSQYQVYYQLPLSSSSSSSSTRSSAQHSPSYKHTSSRSSDSSHTSYSLSSPDPYYISPAISKNPSPELSYYNDFSRSSPPLSGQSSQSYSRSSYGSSGFVQPTETLNTMSSPAIQFSVCPACQTWEHHYASKSRTCAKCGHTRFFTPGSSVMQAPPPSRTYWRPTQYGNSISFAHVREGYEEADAPIIDMLAAWAATQRSYILSYASQVSAMATSPSLKAFWLDCARPSTVASLHPTSSPKLAIVSQGVVPMAQLRADDLLGSFKVLQEEDRMMKSAGGKGIVIAMLMCSGASLALAVRLDEGTM